VYICLDEAGQAISQKGSYPAQSIDLCDSDVESEEVAALVSSTIPGAPSNRITDGNSTKEEIINKIYQRWDRMIKNFFGTSSNSMVRVGISGTKTKSIPTKKKVIDLVLEKPDNDTVDVFTGPPLIDYLADVCFQENPKSKIAEYLADAQDSLQVYIHDNKSKSDETNGNGGCFSYQLGSCFLKELLNDKEEDDHNKYLNTHLNIANNPKAREYVDTLLKCVIAYLPARCDEEKDGFHYDVRERVGKLQSFLKSYDRPKAPKNLKKKYWIASSLFQCIVSSINRMLVVLGQPRMNNALLEHASNSNLKDFEYETNGFVAIKETTHSANHLKNKYTSRNSREWYLGLVNVQFTTFEPGFHFYESTYEKYEEQSLTEAFHNLIDNIYDELVICLHADSTPERSRSVSPTWKPGNRLQRVTDKPLDYAIGKLNSIFEQCPPKHDIPRAIQNHGSDLISNNICWFISATYIFANSLLVKEFLALHVDEATAKPHYKKVSGPKGVSSICRSEGLPFENFP